MRLLFIATGLLVAFWFLGDASFSLGYEKHDREEFQRVQHPEFIPSETFIRLSSAGHEQTVADMYWLQTIQYIGTHVIGGEYKRHLFAMADLVTDLSPRLVIAYTLPQTLLPNVNVGREAIDEGRQERHIDQSIALGEKGTANTCDPEKLENIRISDSIAGAVDDPDRRNPCDSYRIPALLGYTYYFYREDFERAITAYKIASAHDDAPFGIRTLASTLSARTGEYEGAARMLLDLSVRSHLDAPMCARAAAELASLYEAELARSDTISEAFLWLVERVRIQTEEHSEHERNFGASLCLEYLGRFQRVVYFQYLDAFSMAYAEQFGEYPDTASDLVDAGYISVVPRDFQPVGADEYIAYVYDPDRGRWTTQIRKQP